MLTLELASLLTLILIDFSTLSQRILPADMLILENCEKAPLNIKMPLLDHYWAFQCWDQFTFQF